MGVDPQQVRPRVNVRVDVDLLEQAAARLGAVGRIDVLRIEHLRSTGSNGRRAWHTRPTSTGTHHQKSSPAPHSEILWCC